MTETPEIKQDAPSGEGENAQANGEKAASIGFSQFGNRGANVSSYRTEQV